MERLIHYSDRPLKRLRSVPVQDCGMKPRGLWVSVEGDDDWKSWCISEGFNLSRLWIPHQIVIAESANILRLSSLREITELTKRYEADWPMRLDWNQVAHDYDGIIIAPYCWRARLRPDTAWYYGWDCASGCIWNKHAVESIVQFPVEVAIQQE